MAFNTLEYLKDGKVDFIHRLTPYDREHLIDDVRNSDNKNDIINGFLPMLLQAEPSFCFAIIYDNIAFEEQTKALLSSGEKLTIQMAFNLLTNTRWGKEYIYSHIAEFEMITSEQDFPKLFKIILTSPLEYSQFIYHYKSHPNIHIRFLFMKYLLEKYEELFDIIYPDFMMYLTSSTYRENEQLAFWYDYMANEDICNLALLIFKSKYHNHYFPYLKDYILKNYPENDLARILLCPLRIKDRNIEHITVNVEGIKEFASDADRLFLSSVTEKFNIIQNYPNLISKEILEHFLAYYNRFREKDNDVLALINCHRLGAILLEFIDKYLALSKSPTWRFVDEGSTGIVYQMGDYVLKLFRTKWSYEDVICPDLYLIVRNLEQIYLRKENGVIKCGIEVQPYLSRSAKDVPQSAFNLFEEELTRLGYKCTDNFMNGPMGDNCRLLDSYHDANYANPEILPDWFKETPLVLVDRDRVYPKEQRYIRQLSWGY